MRLGIGFNQVNTGFVPTCCTQIFDGFCINREETARGPIFRRHVGDGCLIFQRQVIEAASEIFDEFADHAQLAEHFNDFQHEVGRGYAFIQLAGQFEPDNFRDHHCDRLTEHGRFCLNATDTPAKDRQAIDHGGVAVCANAGVRVGHFNCLGRTVFFRAGPNSLGQIFQVHLVTDTSPRRHNAEIIKCLAAPAQELIAFLVAFIFQIDVFLKRCLGAELVYHH